MWCASLASIFTFDISRSHAINKTSLAIRRVLDQDLHGTLVTSEGGVSTVLLDGFCFPSPERSVKPDHASIPEWAREHVEIASDSDSGVTRVLVTEEAIILDQTHIAEAAPETEEEPGDDHHEQPMFTLVTRKSLVFDETKSHVKAMGASVEIDVAVTSAGVAIAVLQKLPNGGLLVSDAFAPEDDHYHIEPPEDGSPPLSLTTTTGVVRGYIMARKEYSAYEVQVGENFFWIPVSSFVLEQAPPPAASASHEVRFGQIGGDFFVRQRDGSRLHIATALKLLQGWVDHASHNRAERFRVKRKPPEGDLIPMSYYARVVTTGNMAGVSFIISSLGKLVKITSGYSSWPHSAGFDEQDIFVQFTDYELGESGLYTRTARQSEQQSLAFVAPQIALNVTILEEEGGGRLAPESAAALLKLSLVDERVSANEITLEFPKRSKKSRQPLQMPFELDANKRLLAIRRSCSFLGVRQPPPGDVLLAIDGQHLTDTTTARTELRESMRREAGHPNGGSILLRLWKPPSGWSVPSADDDKEESTAADIPEEREALPEWTEDEMKCVKRLCCRTIGGAKEKSNLVSLCKALSIRPDGSHMQMQRRLEAELRRRSFGDSDYRALDKKRVERVLPKHGDMRLGSEAISAKYSETVFTIQQISQLLKSIP